jgi:hypothetical protein
MAVLLWLHRPTRPLAMSSFNMSRNSGVVKDGPCSSRSIQCRFGPLPFFLVFGFGLADPTLRFLGSPGAAPIPTKLPGHGHS